MAMAMAMAMGTAIGTEPINRDTIPIDAYQKVVY